MVTVNAHFDGKVIVPDEPLTLAINERLRVSIERFEQDVAPEGDATPTGWHTLIGLGLKGPMNPDLRFPDEDSLWEGTTGNYLENGPNKPPRR